LNEKKNEHKRERHFVSQLKNKNCFQLHLNILGEVVHK
jgi:hypothetical protein